MPKLKAVRMVGCQSHKDTTYEFSPGLNVIIADNGTGKSVLLKMLRATCLPKFYSKEERKGLIRYGYEFAAIVYAFDDGSIGICKVYPDYNIYLFSDGTTGGQFVQYHQYPPEKLIKNLSVLIDPKGEIIVNIIDLEQNLLMVSTSNNTNNGLMELLLFDERLDRLIQVSAEKEEEYSRMLKAIDNNITILGVKLSQLEYIDIVSLEQDIIACESFINILDTLLEVGRELNNLQVVKSEYEDHDFLINLCSLYEDLISIYHMIEDISTIDFTLEEINSFEFLTDVILESSNIISESEVTFYDNILDILKIFDFIINIPKIEEEDVQLLNIVDIFYSVIENSKELSESLDTYFGVKKRINEREKLVNQIGSRVPCVIYGEVQHIDGQCIPLESEIASATE